MSDRVKLSGIRQSKMIKGLVLAGLGVKGLKNCQNTHCSTNSIKVPTVVVCYIGSVENEIIVNWKTTRLVHTKPFSKLITEVLTLGCRVSATARCSSIAFIY